MHDDLIIRVSSPSYIFNEANNQLIAGYLCGKMFTFHEDHDFRVDVVVGDIIRPQPHPRGKPE